MENNSILKRLVLLVVSLFLLLYVGYQVYQTMYSPLTIEIAQAYSAYDTIDVNALIIRDETVISTSYNGYLYYLCEDGARVAKNGTIAYAYASQEDAMAQQEVKRLESEIELLEELVMHGTAGGNSLELIKKQSQNALQQVITDGSSLSYDNLAEKRSTLLALMNKRQLTIGKAKDFSSQLAALRQEKKELLASSSSAKGKVTSPIAGYFVSQVDGYENLLNYKNVTSMTVADIKRAQSSTADVTGDRVGKIVGDYQWYFVCVLDAAQASKLTVGKNLTISLPFVSSTSVPVTVASLNKDRDGTVAASFVCSYMSDKLSSVRQEKAEIRVKEYAGIYVKDEALQFNEQKEAGVYIRVGDTIHFRKVNAIYHDDVGKFSVCEIVSDSSYLQLYDDIVVSGRGLYDGKVIN